MGIGHHVAFIDGRVPLLDMRAEGDAPGDVHSITRVVLVHPYWDMAIVEAPTTSNGVSLALATSEPPPESDIAVIGHPARNEQEQDLLARLFENVFNVKRVMPGKYMGRQAEVSFGRTVNAGCDDATALSQDFGAAVVDPAAGHLIGVRFSSVFLASAKFVPAWEIARDPEIVKAGVSLSGQPSSPPEWTSAWSSATPARHTLLDAYVARTSGDVARARALLGTVVPDESVRVDHALLQAACELTTDPIHAGELLHQLVAQVPRAEWSNTDWDAVIATRLRLAVDAEAERDFLRILHDQPRAAGLLALPEFRVLMPPDGNLPWKPMTARVNHGVIGGERQLPSEAVAAAKRIDAASDRCLSLRTWIHEHASQLMDQSRLFSRSTADMRELAAAHVAFPWEDVRSIADFLLEKTDLAPHPNTGWSPVIEPLFTMFQDPRGRRTALPDGVKTRQDLEAWLDANATSGRLGSYLTEWLRFDAEIAWQAGLLHLSTELPIERLLKRHFSEKAS